MWRKKANSKQVAQVAQVAQPGTFLNDYNLLNVCHLTNRTKF